MKMTIENIIKTVKVGTQCKMNNTIYEVIETHPYSDVSNLPLYNMKAIDKETLELRQQELNSYNKKNPNYPMTLDEILTIYNIEPMWFITRNVKILN